MHVDPGLWPAIIGATLGLPLIVLWADRILQLWGKWNPVRRIAHAAGFALFLLTYGAFAYGWFIGPNQFAVREVSVASVHWRGAPLKIAVIGDIDLGGPHMDVARLEGVVGRVHDAHPDLVILLGGYVAGDKPAAERSDAERDEIVRGLTSFALLNPRMGVVAVLSAEDGRYGVEPTTRTLEGTGIAVLSNRSVALSRPGASIIIAGADSERPDIANALDGAPPGDFVVVSHTPSGLTNAPGDIALLLTTCAGGACGLRQTAKGPVYATSGVGGRAFRLFDPPEVALITLRSANNDSYSPLIP